MAAKTRIFFIRHVERDKDNKDDPQTPTTGGEIVAYGMGQYVRKTFRPQLARVKSSPQDRATRTKTVFVAGVNGYTTVPFVEYFETDKRLDDFSSDKRPEIKRGLDEAKEYATTNGIEPEQSLFLTPNGRAAVDLKVGEMLEVVDELGNKPGDHLLCGLHGGAIDGTFIALSQRLDIGTTDGMGAAGGMFDKCEGFVAEFDEHGEVEKVTAIRQPQYLKVLSAAVK